jgi:hypothetical protein
MGDAHRSGSNLSTQGALNGKEADPQTRAKVTKACATANS